MTLERETIRRRLKKRGRRVLLVVGLLRKSFKPSSKEKEHQENEGKPGKRM